MRSVLAKGVAHFAYVPLLAVATVIAFAKLLIYAQIISVGEFGSLGKMLLLSSAFTVLGSLGTHFTVARDLPAVFQSGRARHGMTLLLGSVGVSTIVAALALLPGLLGIRDIRVFDLSGVEYSLGLSHGWVQLIFTLAVIENRSRLAMASYARDMFVRSSLLAAIGIVAGWMGAGAVGIMLVEGIATAFITVGILAKCLSAARLTASMAWTLCVRGLRRVPIAPALVLLAASLVSFASINLDRWLAAEFLERRDFGVYSFAWIVLVAAQSIQSMLNVSLFALLSRRFDRQGRRFAFRWTLRISATLVAAGGIGGAIVWSLLPGIVTRVWPDYVDALPLTAPLLIAAVARLSDFWGSYLIVARRERWLLTGQLAAIAVSYVAYLLWLRALPQGPALSLAWLAALSALTSFCVSAIAALADRYLAGARI